MQVMIVEATSLENYLDRYYKPNRRTSTLLSIYHGELDKFGYVCTSQHDNVTGSFIYWPHHPRRADVAVGVPFDPRPEDWG